MSALPLLHLCDSLFPTGAFAHSDGLEWATDARLIVQPDQLGDWMDACLDQTLAHCDGRAVWLSWHAHSERDWATLVAINAEVHALKPSAVARQASRAMGARLVKTWTLLYQPADLQHLLTELDVDRIISLPGAFGVVAASAGIAPRTAVEGFVYTRLTACASAAMRLMPIGQHDAHRVLASRLRRVGAVVDVIESAPSLPSSFAPLLDIASMSHQYVHSRLFRS
jgi:urease accessory protein